MTLFPRAALGTPFGTPFPIPGFACAGATLHERSDVGCVLVTTAVEPAHVRDKVSVAAGVELPCAAGLFHVAAARLALWLSPRSWLVLCELHNEEVVTQAVNAAFPDRIAQAVFFTDYLCWLELVGTQSLELLQKTAFLSLNRGGLPVGHAKRTLVAEIASVVVHEEKDRWLIAVERSRARYFVDRLISAAS